MNNDQLRKMTFEAGYSFSDVVNLCSFLSTRFAILLVQEETVDFCEKLGLKTRDTLMLSTVFLRFDQTGMRTELHKGFDIWHQILLDQQDDCGIARDLHTLLGLFIHLEPNPPTHYANEKAWVDQLYMVRDSLTPFLTENDGYSAHQRIALEQTIAWLKQDFSHLWH